jgi:hypothetical protein
MLANQFSFLLQLRASRVEVMSCYTRGLIYIPSLSHSHLCYRILDGTGHFSAPTFRIQLAESSSHHCTSDRFLIQSKQTNNDDTYPLPL